MYGGLGGQTLHKNVDFSLLPRNLIKCKRLQYGRQRAILQGLEYRPDDFHRFAENQEFSRTLQHMGARKSLNHNSCIFVSIRSLILLESQPVRLPYGVQDPREFPTTLARSGQDHNKAYTILELNQL
jgi:hypothetical protein